MKSRDQMIDHSEDWVDGSWTVDCVCGVNFDDGEEMVDCDECGVWVHTRCSRYVKGEKSFACDKCKLKDNRNISDETEVAQLLVDLPKNTIKREDSFRLNDASRRPLRLWNEKPMEDRVHIHGVPGGDPQLFSGLTGIFTPQLWKAAGYVPKKFNFRYKEFACWEQDEEKSSKDPLDNRSPVDTGADALYSMSKETVYGTRLRFPLGTRVSGKGENFDSEVDVKEPKRLSRVSFDAENFHNGSEKGTTQSFVLASSHQRNDLLTSHDRTGKRKSRAVDKEFDGQKRVRHSSGTVFSPASSQRINESTGDKEVKIFRNDVQSSMRNIVLDVVPQDLVLKSISLQENSIVKVNKYSKCDPVCEARSTDTSNCNSTVEATQKVAKVDHQGSEIKDTVMISSSLINNGKSFSLKKEVAGTVSSLVTYQREKPADVIIDKADSMPSPGCMQTAVPLAQNSQISQDPINGLCKQSQLPKVEVDSSSSNVNTRVDGYTNNHSLAGPDTVNKKLVVTTASCPQHSDKEQMVLAQFNAATDKHPNASCEINDISVSHNMESSEGGKKLKVMSESKNGLSRADNCSESGEATHCLSMLTSQKKMVVSVVRSTSTNSVSKSVFSDVSKAEQSRNSSISNRKQVVTTATSSSIKEQGVIAADRDGERHRKDPKESPKASGSSVWKSSHFSKYSRLHTSKKALSRSKDSECRSFAKAKQDNVVTSDSGESAGSLQARSASLGQKKVTSSGSSGSLQKGKRRSQVTNSVSSKASNLASNQRHLLNASHAALSDEELALLLHQELNSSPRVPRIPRMRQAGSVPQSASPTAAHMLVKRTSGFGGNDYTTVSRRKSKDALTGELDDKPRKADKGSSTRNQGVYQSTSKVDRSKKELDERSLRTYSVVRGKSSISATKRHSSSRNSLKHVFDEEIGTEKSPTYRTLPGLISEIMSKGKRMTYDELCNAVLPHWNNLRKHNGERYAYTSHSQAVLDCLRNRSEWAQLVDRGPKTNPSRKRRKLDTEQTSSDSEDGEVFKNKPPTVLESKNISKKNEVPRGKRNARKGRPALALQGREVKDLCKSRDIEAVSEEEDDGEDDSLYSNSTEHSSSSEDDDGEDSGAASDASISSDES